MNSNSGLTSTKESIQMATSSRKLGADTSAQERHTQLTAQHREAQVVLEPSTAAVFNTQAKLISSFMAAQGFWESDNTGEKIALMHSELSEALEADRKSLPSDHIEGFSGVEEELADVMIRILDFAGHHDLRLAEAFTAKLLFNLTRPYKHGKAY